MSEINVTPFVDVMLSSSYHFYDNCSMLTVGIEIEIPETKAKSVKVLRVKSCLLNYMSQGWESFNK